MCSRQDSNLVRQSIINFQSTALTTWPPRLYTGERIFNVLKLHIYSSTFCVYMYVMKILRESVTNHPVIQIAIFRSQTLHTHSDTGKEPRYTISADKH